MVRSPVDVATALLQMDVTRRFRSGLVIRLLCVIAAAIATGMPRPPANATAVAVTPPRANDSINDTLARDADGCAQVASHVWHPLSGVDYTGRLRIHLPPGRDAALVLFAGDSLPLDLDAETFDGRAVAWQRTRLPPGPGLAVPPDFWLDDEDPWSGPREITRVRIAAPSARAMTVRLALGRRAPRVLARLVGYAAPVRAPICADRLSDDEIVYGTGWYGQEQMPLGPVRWMREHGVVLLSSRDGGAVRVHLRAAPAIPSGADDPTTLRLRVNDVFEAAPIAMQEGFANYEWPVPDTAWVPGTNELLFVVSRTITRGTRTLGLALASVTAR